VISEIVRHSVSEEMYVYPAMREYVPDGEEAVQHDTEEHQQLEEIMKQLEAVPASEPRFDALVGELTEKLRHHAHDEATEQFPQLRKHAPGEEARQAARQGRSRQEAGADPPASGRATQRVFHKLVGPGVGLVDRLRDKLSNRAHT
jgi:hypothetical protein